MRTVVMTAAMIVTAAGLTACTEEQAYCVDLAGYAGERGERGPAGPAS